MAPRRRGAPRSPSPSGSPAPRQAPRGGGAPKPTEVTTEKEKTEKDAGRLLVFCVLYASALATGPTQPRRACATHRPCFI